MIDALLLAFEVAAPEIFAAETAAATATAAEIAAAEAAAAAAAEAAATQAAQAAAAQTATTAAGTTAALSPAQQAYLGASQASAGPGIVRGIQPLPATSPVITPSTNAAAQIGADFAGTGFKATPATTSGMQVGSPYGLGSGSFAPGSSVPIATPTPAKPSWWSGLSPFEKGMTAYLGTTGLAGLGLFNAGDADIPDQSYSGSLSRYRMSPDFRPQVADPSQFQYTPRYYAEGGIASVPEYAKGGNISDAMQYYKMMTAQAQDIPEGRRAPSAGIDTGIYYDTDPDTQRLDALTAAQIRQSKINKRAGIQGQGMARPTAMGRVNMAPLGIKARQEQQDQDISAAQGGIMQAYAMGGPVEQMSAANIYDMQNARGGVSDMGIDSSTGMQMMAAGGISSLGGYAAGGNPRLLKGPGDGMSDNIPAVIGRRQPARLADGEFVIPADVVSHLGNGSTDAGAKKLHHMMTNVRKARTGNPKQGKQINPNKYLPK